MAGGYNAVPTAYAKNDPVAKEEINALLGEACTPSPMEIDGIYSMALSISRIAEALN